MKLSQGVKWFFFGAVLLPVLGVAGFGTGVVIAETASRVVELFTNPEPRVTVSREYRATSERMMYWVNVKRGKWPFTRYDVVNGYYTQEEAEEVAAKLAAGQEQVVKAYP